MPQPQKFRCKRCKKVRAASRFTVDLNRSPARHPWCTPCVTEAGDGKFQDESAPLNGKFCPMDDTPLRGNANRVWCSKTCGQRASVLKRKYNLTPEQYRAMVDATGGRCPLCQKRATSWQVDHNHRTMKVTGVVCTRCNTGALASTYHDVEFVGRLLSYLTRSPAEMLGIHVIANPEANVVVSNAWSRGRFAQRAG